MRKTKAAMGDAWAVPAELLDSILAVAVQDSPEDHYLAFQHLCERYDIANLCIAWLTETGFSHSTFSSANAYIGTDEQGGGPVLLPRVLDSYIDDRPTVVIALLLASQGFPPTSHRRTVEP